MAIADVNGVLPPSQLDRLHYERELHKPQVGQRRGRKVDRKEWRAGIDSPARIMLLGEVAGQRKAGVRFAGRVCVASQRQDLAVGLNRQRSNKG